MTSRSARLANLSLACVISVMACVRSIDAQERVRGAAGVVRDSAGIRIVEHGSWVADSVWATLDPKPLYQVGWRMPGHVFEDVIAGDLLPDGSAVVGDGGRTLEVTILSRHGEVQAVFGQPGQGPGEFSDISAIGHVDSTTVAVEDPRSARISLFREGKLLTDHRLGPLTNLSLLGTDASGRLLMGPPLYMVMGRRYPTPWLAVPLVTVDQNSWSVDTVGVADWDQSILFGGNNPFKSEGFVSAASTGFILGRGDVPELKWIDSGGQLRQIVRWTAPRLPVPSETWSAYEKGFADVMRAHGIPSDGPAGIQARVEAMHAAAKEPLPVFRPIKTDPEGNVWIGTYVPRYGSQAKRPQRFDVVDPQGKWLGVVYLPPAATFTLMAVGRDRVLGVVKDDFEVEAVVAYAMRH